MSWQHWHSLLLIGDTRTRHSFPAASPNLRHQEGLGSPGSSASTTPLTLLLLQHRLDGFFFILMVAGVPFFWWSCIWCYSSCAWGCCCHDKDCPSRWLCCWNRDLRYCWTWCPWLLLVLWILLNEASPSDSLTVFLMESLA